MDASLQLDKQAERTAKVSPLGELERLHSSDRGTSIIEGLDQAITNSSIGGKFWFCYYPHF